MNRLIHITTMIVMLVAIPVTLAGQLKMGYIDSNAIMEQFEDVLDAQVKLEKETRRLQVEYNNYLSRLDSLQRDFERQRLLLSNEKIKEKEDEIQGLYRSTQAFQQEKFGPEGELYTIQARLMAPILEKIDSAVKKIGAEREYDFIFDAAAGALVYALPAYDLTTAVMEELRKID